VAHENGIVEAPHGHVKRRLEQKLILRGSCDFEEAAEYSEMLDIDARRQPRSLLRVDPPSGSPQTTLILTRS